MPEERRGQVEEVMLMRRMGSGLLVPLDAGDAHPEEREGDGDTQGRRPSKYGKEGDEAPATATFVSGSSADRIISFQEFVSKGSRDNIGHLDDVGSEGTLYICGSSGNANSGCMLRDWRCI
jgi:hypothetical protein